MGNAPARAAPIAVTGATGWIGAEVVRRLASTNRVIALRRNDDWSSAISSAEVVIHLAGTLRLRPGDSFTSANVETTRRVVGSVAGANVERIVYISYPAANARSQNAYLRSKGEAEELLQGSGVPYTIFRCPHVYGTPKDPGPTALEHLSRAGAPVVVLGDGKQQVSPVFKGDVVDAIISAALDPRAPSGVFDLAGPHVMSLDDFVRTVNRNDVRILHTPRRLVRTIGRLRRGLTPAMAEVMARRSAPHEPANYAEDAFGLSLTAVSDVWR